MLAMQYTIQLPQDFPTETIVKRVEERSKLFRVVDGMVHKSFLYNEEEKIYAPFYVWQTTAAAQEFLFNDLFRGVIDSFSRPRVRQWNVSQWVQGAFQGTPGFARIEADPIDGHEDLQALQARERQQQKLLSEQNPNLYLHVVALDPDRWEWVRYSVWKDEASATETHADCVTTYQVLHCSGERG